MKQVICLFKGHVQITEKRAQDIKSSLFNLAWDVVGISAESNIKKMKILEKELVSCVRCGSQLKNNL